VKIAEEAEEEVRRWKEGEKGKMGYYVFTSSFFAFGGCIIIDSRSWGDSIANFATAALLRMKCVCCERKYRMLIHLDNF
jgi:hypothetical protein